MWDKLDAWAKKLFDAMLSAPRQKNPGMPRGLGGYRLERIGDIRLDKKQKKGVPHWRAHLKR